MSETTEVLPPTERPHVLYRMYDAGKRLLYVGITFNVAARFGEHEREKHWWSDVSTIDLEHFSSRSSVEIAERAAIVNERPVFNLLHAPRTREPGVGSRRAIPPRSAQIEDEIWEPALRIAQIRGESMSKVIRAAVIRYVARHRHLIEDADPE